MVGIGRVAHGSAWHGGFPVEKYDPNSIERSRVKVDDAAEIRKSGAPEGFEMLPEDLRGDAIARIVGQLNRETLQPVGGRLEFARSAIAGLTYRELMEMVAGIEAGPRPSGGKLDLAAALSRWASEAP